MSRPTPRRPSSSRAATPRPRKIAGGPPTRPNEPPEDPEATEPDVPDEPPPPPDWPVEDPEDDAGGRSVLHSPRLTRVLLVVAAMLALVLVVEAGWWLFRDDDAPELPQAAEGTIAVPEGRPVLPNQVAWQAGVDAAAKAAEKIVNRNFRKYDEEVDAATELMTPDFAEDYRKTTDDVRDEFVASRTTVQIRVRAQGVVRANDTELQALLFIDQFVGRKKGKNPKTSVTGYRALVTMVNTDKGWLVDDLQTE